MRFTELKTLNTSLNPLAPPPATPAMHPHCQGYPPGYDHQIQNPKFSVTGDLGGGMGSVWLTGWPRGKWICN